MKGKLMFVLPKAEQNNEHAHKLLHTFMTHSIATDASWHHISDDGLLEMAKVFGEVDKEQRAEVYMRFVDLLDERGINYNVEQFKQ